MIRRSFRFQVALLASSASFLVLVAYAIIVFRSIDEELRELVDVPLELLASVILTSGEDTFDKDSPFRAAWAMDEGSFRGIQYEELEDEDDSEKNILLLAFKSADGKLIFTDQQFYDERYWDLVKETGRTPAFQRFGIDPEGKWEVRFYAYQDASILLGFNRQDSVDSHREIFRIYSISLPFAFLLVGIVGWMIARFAVKPIESMADSVAEIDATSLHKRLEEAKRQDEVGLLAELINHMLGRLERSYLQARRFTADASHEFKTPLAVIQAEIENQLQDPHTSSEAKETFVRILDEVQRMKALTSSLLFLSKLDSEDFELKREEVILEEILDDSIECIKSEMSKKALSWVVDDSVRPLKVEGDPSLLFHVLNNLLQNACRYNRENGVLKVWGTQIDDQVRVFVGNTGRQIPEQQKDYIFERFYQIEDHSFEKKGYGLGLNIARETARLHGGELNLFENSNDWIVFELTLPVKN